MPSVFLDNFFNLINVNEKEFYYKFSEAGDITTSHCLGQSINTEKQSDSLFALVVAAKEAYSFISKDKSCVSEATFACKFRV